MPSFSATGTFTETRALREGSVIQTSSEPSFCSTLARIRPERVLEPYPNLAANGRPIFAESAAARV